MDTSDMENLDRMVRESELRMRQLSETQTVLAGVSSRYTTEDGMLSVELAADGTLRHLEINPRAMRLDSFSLAERLIEAFGAAQQGLREEVGRVMSEKLGIGDLGDVLGGAEELKNSMDGVLERVSQSVNDAIVQANRVNGRR